MNYDKIERMHEIAERVVAKCPIGPTHFSEQSEWSQDTVAVLTEGRLRGRLFASWFPITKEMYQKCALDTVLDRSVQMWRSSAISALVPLSLLRGPKGKLPE